jgi:hypothetical protein
MSEIKIETEKDVQLLKCVARTGLITENLLPFLKISRQRLYQHIESGNIEKKGAFLVFGSLTNVYVLSDFAKRRMKGDFLIDLYKSDTTQLEHDYVLTKIYLFLKLHEKESWKTENTLRQLYNSEKTTDGLYKTADNKVIGVEVITDSYSKNEIEQKKDFIRKHCDDYIMIHTHKNNAYKI